LFKTRAQNCVFDAFSGHEYRNQTLACKTSPFAGTGSQNLHLTSSNPTGVQPDAGIDTAYRERPHANGICQTGRLSSPMEFGRLTTEELADVDFTLPPDAKNTLRLLSSKKIRKKTEVFVGCAKWGRKDWIGTLYPEKTKEADFLSHYAKHFNSIELNATFYKIPTRKQTAAWRSKVGADFLFCPKVSQSITHIRRLKNAQEVTERFLDGISGFEKNLGPVFLMLHPGMGPNTLESISLFLEAWPKDVDVFMELRHPDWFSGNGHFDEVSLMLEHKKLGMVIIDASGRRDCVHMRLTNRQAFIRFVGNGLHRTDYTRIDGWVSRINEWMDAGIEKVFFFMHQHEELHSPMLCQYLIEQLNEKCGTSIPAIAFQKE
jgi:uncharacterized protein YecE (DUF72 family)